MCQAVVPDLFHDSEQRVLPSVHQRDDHQHHYASHMTKSHDTHAHDWLKGKWRRSHGKYKKIKKLMGIMGREKINNKITD